MRYLILGIIALFLFQNCTSPVAAPTLTTLYVGTYTRKEGHVDGKAQGIYRLLFDAVSGKITVADTIPGMVNPSFLALSPAKDVLWAVNEIGPGGPDAGVVQVYDLHAGARFGQKMKEFNTGAYAPCHIALDKTGNTAIVSNYVGGVVAVCGLAAGENSKPQYIRLEKVAKTHSRQDDSHPHSAIFGKNDRFVYIPDLGTDRVMVYQFDKTTGQLAPAEMPFIEMPDGSGPRHGVFAAHGKTLYVLNELSNKVAVLEVAENGSLKMVQEVSTLPENFTGANTSADIHLSGDGKTLYSSNRGHNSIAVFSVSENGTLKWVGDVATHGATPRNFHLTTDGKWMMVANQDSGSIALFDLKKGNLPVFTGLTEIATPVCIIE